MLPAETTEVDSLLERLSNPGIDLLERSKAVSKLRNVSDVQLTPSAENLMRTLIGVLHRPCISQPEQSQLTQEIRNCFLDILDKLSPFPRFFGLFKHHVKETMAFLISVVKDDRDKAWLALRVMLDVTRHHQEAISHGLPDFPGLIQALFESVKKQFAEQLRSTPVSDVHRGEQADRQLLERTKALKGLTDCLNTIQIIVEDYRQTISRSEAFIPLLIEIICYGNEGQEQTHDDETAEETLLPMPTTVTSELVVTQAKAFVFLCSLIQRVSKLYDSPLVADFLPSIPRICIRLLAEYPRQEIAGRNALYLTMRAFSYHREVDFHTIIGRFVGNGLFVGNDVSAASVASEAYGTLADIVQYQGERLSPDDMLKVVNLCSNNLLDSPILGIKTLQYISKYVPETFDKVNATNCLLLMMDCIAEKFAAKNRQQQNLLKLSKLCPHPSVYSMDEMYSADQTCPPDLDNRGLKAVPVLLDCEVSHAMSALVEILEVSGNVTSAREQQAEICSAQTHVFIKLMKELVNVSGYFETSDEGSKKYLTAFRGVCTSINLSDLCEHLLWLEEKAVRYPQRKLLRRAVDIVKPLSTGNVDTLPSSDDCLDDIDEEEELNESTIRFQIKNFTSNKYCEVRAKKLWTCLNNNAHVFWEYTRRDIGADQVSRLIQLNITQYERLMQYGRIQMGDLIGAANNVVAQRGDNKYEAICDTLRAATILGPSEDHLDALITLAEKCEDRHHPRARQAMDHLGVVIVNWLNQSPTRPGPLLRLSQSFASEKLLEPPNFLRDALITCDVPDEFLTATVLGCLEVYKGTRCRKTKGYLLRIVMVIISMDARRQQSNPVVNTVLLDGAVVESITSGLWKSELSGDPSHRCVDQADLDVLRVSSMLVKHYPKLFEHAREDIIGWGRAYADRGGVHNELIIQGVDNLLAVCIDSYQISTDLTKDIYTRVLKNWQQSSRKQCEETLGFLIPMIQQDQRQLYTSILCDTFEEDLKARRYPVTPLHFLINHHELFRHSGARISTLLIKCLFQFRQLGGSSMRSKTLTLDILWLILTLDDPKHDMPDFQRREIINYIVEYIIYLPKSAKQSEWSVSMAAEKPPFKSVYHRALALLKDLIRPEHWSDLYYSLPDIIEETLASDKARLTLEDAKGEDLNKAANAFTVACTILQSNPRWIAEKRTDIKRIMEPFLNSRRPEIREQVRAAPKGLSDWIPEEPSAVTKFGGELEVDGSGGAPVNEEGAARTAGFVGGEKTRAKSPKPGIMALIFTGISWFLGKLVLSHSRTPALEDKRCEQHYISEKNTSPEY